MKNKILFFEFLIIFAVHDISKINNDAKTINKSTEKKILDRHTVASTAVLSRHCFEVSCSDLSFLFNNQNLKVMHDTFGQTICGEKTAAATSGSPLNGKSQQSVNDAMRFALPKIIESHKQNRHGVFKGLLKMHRNELTLNCMVQMDSMNEAYYFIISQGMTELFTEYCLLRREGVLL
jgi:hypothetical protein